MLVLERRLDESLVIGDDIVITIIDIRGSSVRIGISAPVEIPINRQEIHAKIIAGEPGQRRQGRGM